MKKQIILIVAFLSMFVFVFAQTGNLDVTQTQVRVTGKIIDASRNPLIGVAVAVKGTTQGTITDVNGKFTLNNVAKDAVLHISYVGYMSKDVRVTSGDMLIMLEENAKQMDEVVVIGYGKEKRKDLTGSISSITGNDLRKTVPTTFDQALQGKVAGVMIQQISGQPGGGVSVQIHGVSSISGSNSPLYVIDGVIIPPVSDPGGGSNPLNSINPSDIESIDVLEDASATAIYGSQATNGVIVITTKRGHAGKPRVTYDFNYGYQEIPKELPTVNLQQFATLLNARAQVWGFDARPEFVNPQYLGTGTNWQKELFRKAPMSNNTITLSGGDTKTKYMLSASYFDQEGIALGSEFKRYSVGFNLDNNTTDWLKIGTSIQLGHTDENVNSTTSNVISTALNLTPDIPVKNPDGSWGGVTNTSGWVNQVNNPVGMALLVKDTKGGNQLFGNIYLEIQFTKDLSLRNEVSGNFDFSTEDQFMPTYQFGKAVNNINSAQYYSGQYYSTDVRNYLTYNHAFKKLNVNVMVGHEAQLSTSASVSAKRTNFPSNNVTSINSGDATTASNTGVKQSGPALESYFGRVNLNLDDKYLLTSNVRGDGSSNFPAGNRWVATYSEAFAWRINKELFFRNIRFINDLKLRIGYGLTNNQNIPGNTYVTQLASAANGLSGVAQFQNNLGNPYVQWEKTKDSNLGLDCAFLNSRINFTLNLYNRRTDGLLLQLPLPLYSGTTTGYSPGALNAPYVNVGSVQNRGFDFRISSTNIDNSLFTWRTDFTLSHNANKVVSLGSGGAAANLSETYNGYVVEKTVVGQPIGSFYGYVYDGIFATAKDFKTHALPVDQNGNPRPISPAGGGIWYGDRMFKDLNGDGVIDSKDQKFLGSPLPTFQFGFNNSFTYKNFDLDIFFAGSVGNKVFNELAIAQTNPQNNTSYFTSVMNYARLALINPSGSATDVNNVYVTNPNTNIVGLRNDNTNENERPSNLYIEDGSFIRCKNITLGYRLPENIMKKVHLQSLRLYVTVANAFLITKYSGMDPEIGSWNPLQAGWDSGYYPQPRVYTLGFNLEL
ncbi:SusC/RagA family TonB-linked outer membrane protein [Microbacter margulisiae]|uniref:TonB-linked SusC/RagA family outer membrane protein n=1 Tax=Microbacter margulisiae TaxID=1350067 RepID=A0A7W5DTJ2_9PORP|nr:TonB-dependent receptor [Microbacter margulisiae]MBB3188468.1 TonB-linked SusC/RagA family outer membrane protein [Microbacter margulisiae]